MSASTTALLQEPPHVGASARTAKNAATATATRTPSGAEPPALAPLQALCAVSRFHQVAADPATLAHQLGFTPTQNLTLDDLLLAAQHLGLKAKHSHSTVDRLGLLPLPALALMHPKQC